MNEPLISICIPAYNHAAFIDKTIQSVANQTYKNIELVIINDGSTDQTDQVITSTIDQYRNVLPRIEYKNRHNVGLVKTLNELISMSKGEYLKFIASDDTLCCDTIMLFIQKMETENLDVLFGKLQLMNEQGHPIRVVEGIRGLNQRFNLNEFTLANTLIESPAMGSSWIIRSSALNKIGGFDENSHIEDWDIMLKMIDNHLSMGYIDAIGSCYRVFENKKGPYLGSFKNWLLADLYIINKYKHKEPKAYKQGVRNLFMKNFINNRNYHNNEFLDIAQVLFHYPFALNIFLNPSFVFKCMVRNDAKLYRMMEKIFHSSDLKADK